MADSWLKKRRKRRNKKRASGPVGTEAVALEQMKHNQRNFNYPSEGFVSPIEHTLLYSMIKEGPDIYPANLVSQEVQSEDFRQYMEVKSIKENVQMTSYAQLSAVLALSSVHWPPQKDSDNGNDNVGKVLCKALLKCIVRHAEKNDLDREHELELFFRPVERYSIKRENKAAIKNVMPMYVGYTASILTGNPLPMMVGLSMSLGAGGDTVNERRNVDSFATESSRRANPEKASLLEEEEDLYYESD